MKFCAQRGANTCLPPVKTLNAHQNTTTTNTLEGGLLVVNNLSYLGLSIVVY